MVIRELLTKWGFEVDDTPLRRAEESFGKIKGLSFALTGALVGVAGAIGLLAREYSEHEKTTIAFETMMGSVEEAHKMLADLAGFASKTPFDLVGVQENAKQLMAMGIESDKIISTMKALGDVSAGVNVPLSRIAINYGQIKSVGKAMTIDMKQFAMAGIPIYDELSKMTGKTRAELMEMTTQGLITFPMIEEAFIRMTSKGGKFEDLMFKQSSTLGGMFSNLMDNLQQLRIRLGEFASGPLKKVLTGINKFFDENGEKIIAKLGKSVESLTNWFISLASALWSVGNMVWPFIDAIGGIDFVIKALITTLGVMITAFAGIAIYHFIDQIKMVTGAIKKMDTATLALSAKILFWVALFALVALAVEDLYRFVSGDGSLIGDILGSMFDAGTVDMIRQNIMAVIGIFTGFFNGLREGFVEAFSLVLPLFSSFGSTWSEIFQNMRDVAVSLFNVLSPYFQGFFKMVIERMTMFAKFMGRLIGWIVGGISMIITGILGGVATVIGSLVKMLSKGLADKLKTIPVIGKYFDTGNEGQNNLNSANAGYMTDENFLNSLAMANQGASGIGTDASKNKGNSTVTNTVGEVVVNVPSSVGTPEEVGSAVKNSMSEFFIEKMNMANADLQPTREN